MGMIPRVICRRCGRQFSGVRARCPYCGTRRIKQSDRVPAPTPGENPGTPAGQRASVNTRWQMVFGGILVAAVILAVIVLVSVSLNGTGLERESAPPSAPPVESAPPTATPTPPPTVTPTPTITSLEIYYAGSAMNEDVTFNLADGNVVTLTAGIWPALDGEVLDGNVVWSVSDPEMAELQVEGNTCTVTFTGKNASCNITVECFGLTDTSIIRTRNGNQ